MDFTDIQGWGQAAKTMLDAIKAGRDVLPKGQAREEVDKSIAAAEGIMQRTDAKLAHDLGYHLHKCTFPPQIMLRNEKKKAWVCPKCRFKEEDFVFPKPPQKRRDVA